MASNSRPSQERITDRSKDVIKSGGEWIGSVERDELLGWFAGKVAKWWIPDDVVFVESIPLGATGKMQKHKLRERFAAHRLPN